MTYNAILIPTLQGFGKSRDQEHHYTFVDDLCLGNVFQKYTRLEADDRSVYAAVLQRRVKEGRYEPRQVVASNHRCYESWTREAEPG